MDEVSTERAPAVPSDAALIAALKDGDDSAYGELYRRHVRAARGLARQLVRGESEVDDVVSETFARVLDLMRRGGGPDSGFRPYLLTALRRITYDRYRTDRRSVVTDEIESYDPGTPFVDPAVEGLERSLIARAFYSLPERWRAVLWHTEVEEAKPAEVAPLLGLSANGVAALAYRAREGLRQAYLQMHLSGEAEERCRPALERLGAYIRDGLSKRETPIVESHLRDCADCQGVYAELADVNVGLKGIIGPLIAGPALGGYLAAVHSGGAGLGGLFGWWHRMPKRAQQGTAAGVAAAAVAGAVAFALTADHTRPKPPPPQAAARPKPPPPQPKPAQPKPKPPKPKPPVPQPPPPPKRKPPKAAPPAAHSSKPPSRPPKPQPPKPGPQPRLSARVGSVGELVRDQYGVVGMWLTNAGRGAAKDVIAKITLPRGVTFTTPNGPGSAAPMAASAGDGWTCRPSASAVRCGHGRVRPGATSRAYLRVRVAANAPLGTPPRVAITSGRLRVHARGSNGVRSTGLAARYATDGNVRTVQVGNALLSCPEPAPGCAQARRREGHRLDDDLWPMRPYDADADPGTTSSSAAKLALPGKVKWAGLYWSGVRGDGDVGTAKLRGPGQQGYTTVHTTDVRPDRLPSFPTYQAFADVTGQVRKYGAGVWWGADAPTEAGATHFAGWSLVVVVEDRAAPYAQAAVLDSTPDRTLSPGNPSLALALSGLLPAAVPARIGVVAWEGDADLPGDRLTLGGRALRPAEGDHDPENFMNSAAHGARGPKLTFGVDVKTCRALLPSGAVLRFETRQDAYVLGVVTLTSPMRT